MATDKLLLGHQQGMKYALQIAKEKGIEGLEEEINFRGITGIPISIPRAVADKALKKMKTLMIKTCSIAFAAALHDTFDFGAVRLKRALDAFQNKLICIAEDYCTWEDNIQMLQDETGIRLNLDED